MPLLLILALASGADVRHGTAEQCSAWYPSDWKKELACSEIVLTPQQQVGLDRVQRLCEEFDTLARKRGFVFSSAHLRANGEESSCVDYDKKQKAHSRPASGG